MKGNFTGEKSSEIGENRPFFQKIWYRDVMFIQHERVSIHKQNNEFHIKKRTDDIMKLNTGHYSKLAAI